MKTSFIILCFTVFSVEATLAQKFYTSPVVHGDRTVSFRVYAPDANRVVLNMVNSGIEEVDGTVLQKSDDGLWSVTLGPFDPEIYYYTFTTDGSRHTDIRNQKVKKWLYCVSVLEIAGEVPLTHDLQNVTHGTVHLDLYNSRATNSQRPVVVYTPPGYRNEPDRRYPVLFLLHGWGDNELGWVENGRINYIIDNLVARGVIKPLIAVMPDAHTAGRKEVEFSEITDEGFQAYIERNIELTEKDLLQSLLPFIESNYRIKTDAASRGIMGVSMSGPVSLEVGISNLDTFSWIGAFSGSFYSPEKYTNQQVYTDAGLANSRINLLWLSYGKDELKEFPKAVYDFHNWLTDRGIKHTWYEGPGRHEWDAWRVHVVALLKVIFK